MALQTVKSARLALFLTKLEKELEPLQLDAMDKLRNIVVNIPSRPNTSSVSLPFVPLPAPHTPCAPCKPCILLGMGWAPFAGRWWAGLKSEQTR